MSVSRPSVENMLYETKPADESSNAFCPCTRPLKKKTRICAIHASPFSVYALFLRIACQKEKVEPHLPDQIRFMRPAKARLFNVEIDGKEAVCIRHFHVEMVSGSLY